MNNFLLKWFSWSDVYLLLKLIECWRWISKAADCVSWDTFSVLCCVAHLWTAVLLRHKNYPVQGHHTWCMKKWFCIIILLSLQVTLKKLLCSSSCRLLLIRICMLFDFCALQDVTVLMEITAAFHCFTLCCVYSLHKTCCTFNYWEIVFPSFHLK